MTNNPKDNAFVEELIRVMRPANKNHIFDDVENDIITTTDNDGLKLVIIRPKQNV